MALSDELNLELAWRRVCLDQQNHVFVNRAYERELVEIDSEEWRKTIAIDDYTPHSQQYCDVPKKGFTIRPGCMLRLEDQLVYAALAGQLVEGIQKATSPLQGTVDFSYPVSDDPNKQEWLGGAFTGWRDFRNRSIEIIDDGAKYVVITDISSFYDCIDIATLSSDLRALEVASKEALGLLSKCLNKWSFCSGSGIPQGFGASHILSKYYLSRIDESLAGKGIQHLRYSDDIHMFCGSLYEAKKAVVELANQLRKRGLSLHSAKTKVLPADLARLEIDGIVPALQTTLRDYVNFVEEIFGSNYLTLQEAENRIAKNPDNAPVEILEGAYERYVEDTENDFNKTIFHFLLNRMKKAGCQYALEHSIGLIHLQPQETTAILDYVSSTSGFEKIHGELEHSLSFDNTVYGYQMYQLLCWTAEHFDKLNSDDILQRVRNICSEGRAPKYVKSVARQILGNHGSGADLEQIEAELNNDLAPLERAQVAACLGRMESGKRNAVLKRLEGENELMRRAVAFSKKS